jgi:putative hydrolase of the HAD superfamily
MVGNSPKSDVNPALAAGLNAVFVPHDTTWVLEHEEIVHPPAAPGRLLVLEKFSAMRQHF